ncbi:MAG TPA: protein-disulfide reductase DsbD domain-containing protein [Steroidobacteraceae bacterium]|nr:protein-disulfide reductase DsbD domain-containing protein [Steroidobacteraceae bacterium]
MKLLTCTRAGVHWAMLCLLAVGTAYAKPWWMRGIETNETDFLDPDVAFRVAARMEGGNLTVRWVIADGYYLYRQKIAIAAQSPDLFLLGIGLPRGTMKTDPYLGRSEIFTQQVEAKVVYRRLDYGAHPLELRVTYQGCAEAGLCYPPITKVLSPVIAETPPPPAPLHRWQWIAIVGGAFAFFLAGFLLRKGRRLELPAAT